MWKKFVVSGNNVVQLSSSNHVYLPATSEPEMPSRQFEPMLKRHCGNKAQ